MVICASTKKLFQLMTSLLVNEKHSIGTLKCLNHLAESFDTRLMASQQDSSLYNMRATCCVGAQDVSLQLGWSQVSWKKLKFSQEMLQWCNFPPIAFNIIERMLKITETESSEQCQCCVAVSRAEASNRCQT